MFKNLFKSLVESLERRTERNAIKVPDASWKDIKGIIHSEDIVLKRSVFPLVGDWGRIYPTTNPEEPIFKDNGSINWKKINIINVVFGGKQNLIKLLVVLGVVAMILLAFKEFFSQYELLKASCPQLNLTQIVNQLV